MGNAIQEKSYGFALEIINLYKDLKDENILFRQLLRSGTSIGANVEEALGGVSKRDFVCKLSIAYKEARETKYWICLLKDSGFIKEGRASVLLGNLSEIIRIIAKIQVTMSKKYI